MNRRRIPSAGTADHGDIIALAVCCAFFSGGIFAGVFFSGFVAENDPAARFLAEPWELSGTVTSLLFDISFHFAAFILGSSLVGAALVPLVCFVRGFVLAFSVALCVRVLGPGSVGDVVRMFAPAAFLTVPSLMAVSAAALRSSLALLGYGGGGGFGRRYFARGALCILAAVAASLLERALAL